MRDLFVFARKYVKENHVNKRFLSFSSRLYRDKPQQLIIFAQKSLNMEDKKARFLELLRSTRKEKTSIDKVINYLETSGFFLAPASTKHHLSYEGGLLEHSLNVYDMAIALRKSIVELMPEVADKLPEDSIKIAALSDDTCKADIYKKAQKWKKDEQGRWVSVDSYETDYSQYPLGHGEKSVMILLSLGLKMNLAETLAIRWHMGAWDLAFQSFEAKSNISEAGNRYPLLSLIQAADNLATHIMEQGQEVKPGQGQEPKKEQEQKQP